MIIVEEMGKKFGISLGEGEDKVTFVFTQLDYFSRNKVATASTAFKEGKLTLDVGLACFYNLKYALKEVKGLYNPDETPYTLEFEEGLDELTDKCINELLALPFSDKIIYMARDLSSSIPNKITNPVTGEEIEGIEVIPPEKLKGTIEKK